MVLVNPSANLSCYQDLLKFVLYHIWESIAEIVLLNYGSNLYYYLKSIFMNKANRMFNLMGAKVIY